MSPFPKIGMAVSFLCMALNLVTGDYITAMWCVSSGLWALMAGLNEQV